MKQHIVLQNALVLILAGPRSTGSKYLLGEDRVGKTDKFWSQATVYRTFRFFC